MPNKHKMKLSAALAKPSKALLKVKLKTIHWEKHNKKQKKQKN